MHGKFWKGKNGALTSAIIWTLCAVLWVTQLYSRYQAGDQGMVMITLVVAGLSIVNAVIYWWRWFTLRNK